MVTKEEIVNDTRFFIDEFSLENFIAHKKIKHYKLVTIKVGDILRRLDGSLFPLNETEIYKCIDNDYNSSDYDVYRKRLNGDDYDHHSFEGFMELKAQLDVQEYDITKGAIIIDQYNCILDGQHRSCLLLKKYGESYSIEVVKIYYYNRGIRTTIKYCFYVIKRYFQK